MRRKYIRFCRHARLKFRVLRLHKFPVTEGQVRQTLLEPVRTIQGYRGRKIAEKPISSTHALRVVYEEGFREMEVITFYPVRREH